MWVYLFAEREVCGDRSPKRLWLARYTAITVPCKMNAQTFFCGCEGEFAKSTPPVPVDKCSECETQLDVPDDAATVASSADCPESGSLTNGRERTSVHPKISLSKDKGCARNGGRHRTFRTDPAARARYLSHSINRRLRGRSAIAPHYPPDTMCLTGTWRMGIRTSTPPNDARRW